VPQRAPEGSILRDESAFQLLRRVKKITKEWVSPGKRSGQNGHNVSATISLHENEWTDAGEWMWENRNSYNGLAVLPYDGGTYQQAPFEDCSEEKYTVMLEKLASVDLSKIVEEDDNTDLKGEAACAGGACEIT
jgi:ribonucleoside-diphosphate reductase alpha chain